MPSDDTAPSPYLTHRNLQSVENSLHSSKSVTIPPVTKAPLSGPWSAESGRDFMWSDQDEPHQKRRKEILEKYPQIYELFVYEPLTAVYVLVYVSMQLLICSWITDASYTVLVLTAYFVGGFLNHGLQLGAHELSHNLCWRSPTANKLTAIFATLPTGFPSAITFGRYHYDHHLYQGHDGIDMDVPTEFEANFFTSAPMKALWVFFQPFAYALRPLFIKPKPFTFWEGINWFVNVSFDLFIYTYFGPKAITYFLASTFLGLGLHPAAGHFIAEHFAFSKGQETYSYYGVLNYLNFNVGYHNEHHDFPRVPWTKLPKLREIAKEYYDLPSYTSYISVLYNYIMDPTIGPSSRIKRKKNEERKEDKKTSRTFAVTCAVLLVASLLYFWSKVLFG